MIRVPPEIDRLMWAVAENPVPDAMDEFGKRYPDYRGELLKRVDMVRGIRTEVKGSGQPGRQIPKFEPRPLPSPIQPRGLYLAFGLGIFAIVFAAFTVIMSFRSAPTKTTILPLQSVDQPFVVPPVVTRQGPQPQTQSLPYSPPALVTPPETAPPVPLVLKRRDLKAPDIQLLDALSLITAGTNLKLEIGPGFINQKVSLAFHDRTTMEMLREMAKEYAFTVSDEGDGHMLVLPAPDKDADGHENADPQRRVGP